ncbi:MAG: cytochrome C [Gallionella sp.]
MKKISLLFGIAILSSAAINSIAAESQGNMEHKMHHNMTEMGDTRTSLNLSPDMKQHQLTNMRSHVEAVQSIVGLMAKGDFDQASKVAHSKIGLTDEMKKMCDMFENADFKKLGLAFHKSGDDLGNVLKTKDTNKSLQALHDTMEYCVQCHATYRQ